MLHNFTHLSPRNRMIVAGLFFILLCLGILWALLVP